MKHWKIVWTATILMFFVVFTGFSAPRGIGGKTSTLSGNSREPEEISYEDYVGDGGLHIIATDSNGDYRDHFSEAGLNGFIEEANDSGLVGEQQVNREALRLQLKELFAHFDPKRYDRIVVFIHGGLNSEKVSRKGAFNKIKAMRQCAIGKRIFPIFLTWDSGWNSSYRHNIFYESGGISYRNAKNRGWKLLGMPLRAASDVIVGIVKAPENILSGVGSVTEASRVYKIQPLWYSTKRTYLWQLAGIKGMHTFGNRGEPGKMVSRKVESNIESQIADGAFAKNGGRGGVTAVSVGGDSQVADYNKIISTGFWMPVKATTTVGHDWIATRAWHNMVRRTRTLVRPFERFIHYRSVPADTPPDLAFQPVDGVAGILVDYVATHAHGHPVELYGHSMGAMISNEIIREINEGRIRDPKFQRIVFLAAACSIRDFMDTTGRYLKDRRKVSFVPVKGNDNLYEKKNGSACLFFNLSLHPRAEVSEIMGTWINPLVSGSLLVWIDNYYQTPEAFLDRTLGTFTNVILAKKDHLINGEEVVYKAFGYGVGKLRHIYGPQKHGELDDFKFWLDGYLNAQTKRAPEMNGRRGYLDMMIEK